MIILGLGTNLGDRQRNLRLAIDAIAADLLVDIRESKIMISPALMPKNSPVEWDMEFLNMAIAGQLKQQITSQEFLVKMQKIEIALGRNPSERWAPRVIDIDILAWNDEVIKTQYLQVPHPALHERDFARVPFLQLLPNWVHPELGKKLADFS